MLFVKFVPQKCGTFMFVPHVPQMWYKCGTQKRAHTFFGYFEYYALNVCKYLLLFNKCIDNKHCTRFIMFYFS